MNSKEIERNLNEVVINLIPEEFIYDFLLAFGISKTSISRLKKGDFNMSKIPGEILYRGRVFFKQQKMMHYFMKLTKCLKMKEY